MFRRLSSGKFRCLFVLVSLDANHTLFVMGPYYISHCFIILESCFTFQAISVFWCFNLFLYFRGVLMNFLCIGKCLWIFYVCMNFICFNKFIMFLWISYVYVNFLCFSVLFPNVSIFWYPSNGQVMNIIMFGDIRVLKRWKCIIFDACDNWKLVFSKPKITLTYQVHVPKCIWWTFMMAFMVDLIGGERLWEWNN